MIWDGAFNCTPVAPTAHMVSGTCTLVYTPCDDAFAASGHVMGRRID